MGKLVSLISFKILTFSFIHFLKHLVFIPSNLKFMDSKVNKGKNVIGTSSSTPVSAISLLHHSCAVDFEKSFRNRIVMKQHVYDPVVAGKLHILEIVNLMEYQEINNFLKVSTDYNEDLIWVFYVGLQLREWCSFRFKMGKNSYHFTTYLWKEVFGICVLSHEATMYDHAFHHDFNLRIHLNSCLKAPRP